ncbi:unnamed protein product [Amoebophrya sp. A25]|nr:unnamed protein product [Amoebophrya sp. A25]|eukprot:GSA25T00017304001.1
MNTSSSSSSSAAQQHGRSVRSTSFARGAPRHDWRIFPRQKNYHEDEDGDYLILDPQDPLKNSKSLNRQVNYERTMMQDRFDGAGGTTSKEADGDGGGGSGSGSKFPQDGDVLVLDHLDNTGVAGGGHGLTSRMKRGSVCMVDIGRTKPFSGTAEERDEQAADIYLDVDAAKRAVERHVRQGDFRFVLGHPGVDYRLDVGEADNEKEEMLLWWQECGAQRTARAGAARRRNAGYAEEFEKGYVTT